MTEEIKEKVKLQNVLKKVKIIADDQFEGEVTDNILSIFNQLPTVEKRTLLKGMINICILLEKNVLTNDIDVDAIVTKENVEEIKTTIKTTEDAIHDDILSIDLFNQKEMIRLKTWMFKFFSIGGVLGIFGILALLFMLSNDKEGMFKSVIEFFNILKEASGL
jgi:hypothetical protein